MPEERGVAITGLGLVLPQGVGLAAAEDVFAGRSAVRYLPEFADVPGATGAAVLDFVPPSGTADCDRAIQFAVAAADEAWNHAGLADAAPAPDRVATVLSLSKGAIFALAHRARCGGAGSDALLDVTPDAAARTVAARLGLTGPIAAPVTACASGGHALVLGAGLIRRGVVDAALVGAAEASLHPMIMGSYRRMGVLADAGADPATSVRPFSASRRGFAIGEGAGVLVLESTASAERRGAQHIALVRGWASGCQTAGLIDMETGGETLAHLLRLTLKRAATPPEGVIDLTLYPRSYLKADPDLAFWHVFGMEWKEHIAWFAPLLATAVAFVVWRYGAHLARDNRLRQALIVLFILAFVVAGIAGLLGMLVTKAAPVL